MLGGGTPHRLDLSSALMIKDNHRNLHVANSHHYHPLLAVEWECRQEAEAWAAVEQGARVIMLDNFSPGEAQRVAQLIKARDQGIWIEVSGGLDASNALEFVSPHIDSLAVGALNHSAPILDFSLKINPNA